ncbi:MAG: pitrilysin family protein [Pseudomonadota bacterium]
MLFLLPRYASAALVEIDTNTGFKSVYLAENTSASTVTVALVVLAGEVDVEGPEGLSHYLEHLMFWHADNAGGPGLHARGGNAWVNGIVSSYYNQSEKTDLPAMLEFIARLYTPPDLDKDFMLRERSVVAREYDLRVSENPDWRIRTAIRRHLYNNHPVSRSVIGTPESIQSLSIESAVDFHRRYYHPRNSVLFISGDISQTDAVNAVNSHLHHLESGNLHAAEWRSANLISEFDKTFEFIDDQARYERLLYGSLSRYPKNINGVKRWYALKMLESILDSALDGGVARPLRMDNFILRSFAINMHGLLKGSFEFSMYAEPDKGIDLPQATEAIADALRTIAKQGVPLKTLERVRKRMLQTEQRIADDQIDNYWRMAVQLSEGVKPVSGQEHLDQIKAVSLAEVNRLLDALANPVRRSIAHIKPPQ